MRKLAALLGGVAMLGLVGVAQADEPMALSATQMDQVTAGYGYKDYGYKGHYKKHKCFHCFGDHVAYSDSYAYAYGPSTYANTYTYSDTGRRYSIASGSSYSHSY